MGILLQFINSSCATWLFLWSSAAWGEYWMEHKGSDVRSNWIPSNLCFKMGRWRKLSPPPVKHSSMFIKRKRVQCTFLSAEGCHPQGPHWHLVMKLLLCVQAVLWAMSQTIQGIKVWLNIFHIIGFPDRTNSSNCMYRKIEDVCHIFLYLSIEVDYHGPF